MRDPVRTATTTAAGGAYARETALPAELKRISWGAILAGAVVALAVQALLTMLGLAVGFGAIDPATESDPLGGIPTGAAIWWVVAGIIALFAGGWVAGRLAGIPRGMDGLLHGVVTWGLVALVSLWLMTTAVSRLVGGATAMIGDTLQVAGEVAQIAGEAVGATAGGLASAVAAIAPEAGEAVEQATRQQDLTIQDLRQAARRFLRQAGLQPQSLERQAQQAGQAIQQTAADVAQSPGDAGEDVARLIDRLFGESEGILNAEDLQAAAQAIARETGISEQEVQRQLEEWQQQYRQARQQVEQAVQQAQEAAEAAADKAAAVLAQAALWGFIASALGLIAAAIGGRAGIPHSLPAMPARRAG